MKRIFTILFVLCLVVALSLSISAESTNKLTYAVGASAPTVSANTEFTIFVDITENTGICWLKAVVTYDSSVLSYVGASTDSSAYDSNKITVNHRSGKAIVVLGSMNVVQETNPTMYTKTGTLVALTFKVNPLASGETKIDVTTDVGNVLKIVNGVAETDYSITNASLSIKVLSNASHTCTPDAEIRENVVPANCNTMGSYDSVIKCSICGTEISRTKVVLPANEDHVPGEATKENVVAGTCKTEETYDMVTRCTRCDKIVKTESKKGSKGDHVEDFPKVEYTTSTCVEQGTFIEIYNCKTCGIELDRKINKLPLATHTPGAPHKENIVAPTCTKFGSYNNVTYCSVCNTKLSTETVTQEKLAHNAGTPVEENRVESKDCLTQGSYDYVTYCTVCNIEMNRIVQTLPVAAHKPGNPPTETAPQSCTVCGFVLKPALGHTHKWNDSLVSNATGHWYSCSGCGEKKDYADHKYDNICDSTCNVCGMTRTVSNHKFDNDCDETCNVCSAKRSITHTYDNNCDTTCNVCSAVRTPGDHVFGSWTTVKEPTISAEGLKERKCNICGYAESETIPVKVEETTVAPPVTTTPPETTEEPVVTTEPVETTEAPEVTDAPETTASPAPETTEKPEDTDSDKKENGCGSVVSAGIAIIAILGGAIILKKRD